MGRDKKKIRSGGLLRFELEEILGRTRFTGFSGLPMVAEALRASGAYRAIKEGPQSRERRRERGLTDAQLVESFCLLLAAGGEHLEDFDVLRADEALAELVRHELPSPTRAKEYLYAFADSAEESASETVQGRLFEKGGVAQESGLLASLGGAVWATVHAVQKLNPVTRATIDIDATITESTKREAKMTYEGERG